LIFSLKFTTELELLLRFTLRRSWNCCSDLLSKDLP